MNRIYRNLLLLVALVSIGFNIFFIAGYRRARLNLESTRATLENTRSTIEKLKTDKGTIQLLSRRLNFTPEQEAKLVTIKENLQKDTTAFNKAHSPEIDAFWDEMVKDNPNPEKVRKLEHALSVKRQEMRHRVVERIREAFACLTPAQRRDLARIIKDRSFLKQL